MPSWERCNAPAPRADPALNPALNLTNPDLSPLPPPTVTPALSHPDPFPPERLRESGGQTLSQRAQTLSGAECTRGAKSGCCNLCKIKLL
eukprot:4098194-Prymnesium_polylepis.2